MQQGIPTSLSFLTRRGRHNSNTSRVTHSDRELKDQVFMMTQDEKAAEKRLQAGIDAFYDGKLDAAAEAFSDAEIRFRLLGDFKRSGDSRTMLADIQRQKNQLEQAANSYQKAMRLYRDANLPLNEAGSSLSLGHV